MRLYTVDDVQDYHFLANKYMELASVAEKAMKERDSADSINVKFALTSVKLAKDMMDNLGTEVPDDKAVALGFGK